MDGESTTKVLLATAAVAVAATAGFLNSQFSQKQSKQRLEEEKESKKQEKLDKLKENLVKNLNEDSTELKQNAICYYMHNFYLGEDVPTSLIDEIKKEYKIIYSLPYIDFLSYHLVGQEIDILDEILEERLKNYSKDEHRNKKQRYESMLQEEAKEEALKKFTELKQVKR